MSWLPLCSDGDRDCYGGEGRERRLYTPPLSFLRRLTHAVRDDEAVWVSSCPRRFLTVGSALRKGDDQIAQNSVEK